MISRRGFLSAVGIGSVFDPGRLLAAASRPRWHWRQIGCLFEISSIYDIDSAEFRMQYLYPALKSVSARLKLMEPGFKLVEPELPVGMYHAEILPHGLRFIVGFDAPSNKFLGRIDALVWGAIKSAKTPRFSWAINQNYELPEECAMRRLA